ncbi:14728_t:CDS:2 [Acaulospora morrowiae]|uniref:14728_t:CDS:1 n=1 Tax=Acaulospora morrowiae TaxID=94023 RepID=A0A9N9BND5_9GLOM|nr:14728_t:CDS:2 [Acaulospora morrowiae]
MEFAPSQLDINEIFDLSSEGVNKTKEVVVPPVKEENPEVLIARKYQIELYEKAKNDNVIAVLDTGSGKTFIAVMLIKEITAEERYLRTIRRETKLTFFLVNLVPLVFQQANVIKTNCDVRVKHFCGEMGVDLWSEKQWKEYFENNDVLVMTAQIFLNVLRHGFISLSQVNLLVFDECHHTSKKHPYNLIMREFYDRCPEENRPKIFGMTASPVNTRSEIHSASHLEHSLNARVFTASDTEELRKYVNRPEEISIKYDPAPPYEDTLLYNTLSRECIAVERFKRAFLSAQEALRTLGPWCSDNIWKYMLEEMEKKNEGKLDPDEYDLDLLEEEKKLLQKAINIVGSWVFRAPECNIEMLSPKVIQLIRILDCFKETSENFCGIVFVERRHTANVLHQLIKETVSLKFIIPGVLVGHGTAEEGDLQMKYKEQNKIINSFRDGKINLLIATNVAEEGLDIQPCNVVIRFDFFNTLRAYIQSRGRARRKDSKYIVMIEKGNLREQGILVEMQEAEERMKKCHDSAVSLIYYYCSKLHRGDGYGHFQPEFKVERNIEGYICSLMLPSNAPVREVTGDISSSRNKAKKSAAFKACAQLYDKKELDNHLLPVVEYIEEDHEMKKPVKDEHGLVEGARKSRREYPLKAPDLWKIDEDQQKIPEKLYGTVLKLDFEDETFDGQSYRTFCFLTRTQFPEVPPITLYFHGVPKTLKVIPYSTPIAISAERLEMAFKFTLRVFTSIANKEFICNIENFSYLIAPLVHNAQINEHTLDFIDWENIERGVTQKHIPIDVNRIYDLNDAVIIDYADNLRRYFIHKIRLDLNPLSSVPNGMAIREVGCQNFEEYYRKNYNDLELKHPDQPLLEVRKISKVMNFLQPVPGVLPTLKGRVATFVIPEFCKEFSIRASIFRSALMLPAIFTRIDSQLLTIDLRQRLELPVNDDLLLEALTTPSANMEMNYERLETLGDSVLKFFVTIRLYVMFPDKHEGQLHCQRIRIICNRELYRSAKRLHLFEHVTSLPFNRRAWRPANMLTTVDDPETFEKGKVHELADKTLADVVEATLAAAYLSGGTEAALKCSIAMGVPMDDITEWNHFHLNNRNPPRVSAKTLRKLNIEKIESICGYTFKNKILIAEALTHASLPNSTTACYQRLEFLGDAVLDFLTVKYLFEKYPDGTPGMLTDLKDSSVNNQILGAICERIGLHKHIIHFSPKLMSSITEFVNVIEEIKERGEAVGEYWSDTSVPKVMSDVVESMLGAVIVDAEFDPEASQRVFDKWVRPVLDEFVTPETVKVHPMKRFTEFMQKRGCDNFLFRNLTSEGPDSPQKCVLFIHDSSVSHAISDNIRSARKMAAQEVLEKIDSQPEFLESVCSCAVFPKDTSLFDDDDEEVLLD